MCVYVQNKIQEASTVLPLHVWYNGIYQSNASQKQALFWTVLCPLSVSFPVQTQLAENEKVHKHYLRVLNYQDTFVIL
jgi:hypothetical protein